MPVSKVAFLVVAADDLAELSIVDSSYLVRARGVGSIEGKLPPGLYMARIRSGDVMKQEPLHLTHDQPSKNHVQFDVVGDLASSAPTKASDALVPDNWRLPAVRSTWIFIATRAVEPMASEVPAKFTIAWEPQIALCTLEGRVVDDLTTKQRVDVPSGHRAFLLECAPGWYTLSIPLAPNLKALFPLCVHPQWSPSVFLEARYERSDEMQPDIDRMLVTYDPREWQVQRFAMRLRAIELARRSLVSGENLLTPALMKVLYDQKFQDPMLGLLAAHLLLLERKPSKEQLTEVIQNTAGMLGEHFPDVMAIREYAQHKKILESPIPATDQPPLEHPPLLWASWKLLSTIPNRKKELVSRNSLLRLIASRIVRSRTWLMWRAPEPTDIAALFFEHRRLPRIRIAAHGPVGGAEQLAYALNLPEEPLRQTGAQRTRRPTDEQLLQKILERNRALNITDEALEIPLGLYAQLKPLERDLLRACLQLRRSERADREIPAGYVKRLAAAFEVPLPLLREAIKGLLGELELPMAIAAPAANSTPSADFGAPSAER